MSKAITVVTPRPPVVLETSLIVLKFRVYGLDEETELSLLRTLVSQNDEVICTMPDIRPKRPHFYVKQHIWPHGERNSEGLVDPGTNERTLLTTMFILLCLPCRASLPGAM